MKKAIYLTGILIALGMIGYFGFTFFRNTPQENDGNGTQSLQSGLLPSVSENPLLTASITDQFPKTQTITLGTNQGAIEVKNFYKTAVDTEEGSVILKNLDDYVIAYRRDTSIFRIELFSPSAAVRQNAEHDFLQILGTNQTDACKLDVQVILFRSAQDGENSRLSFCFDKIQ